MLEKEFQYYLDHQDEIVKQYNGKHIVIVGEEIVKSFDEISDAYKFGVEKYGEGKFLLMFVQPGEESYTQTYRSRVVFS